jgi:hypothetical protein
MKTQQINPSTRARHGRIVVGALLGLATLAAAVLCVLSSTWPAQAGHGNPNPGVTPPHALAYGKTYGEWAAAWWQWALSIPADRNPLTDRTGEFCDEGQSGPVWFRGGAARSRETTCHVPVGKAIFMPVYNWIFGAGVYDCDPSVPGVPCDEATLRASAAAATEAATVLEVSLDGVPIQHLHDYRASSPTAFAVTFPEDNLLGLNAGTYFPQVADGYWLMLAPLPKGKHTLLIHVEAPSVGISFTTLTHLVVE